MFSIADNEKLQDAFDLEIDLTILMAFRTILIQMRNCEKKLYPESHSLSHRSLFIDDMILKIHNTGKRANETMSLSLFQDSCLQAKIKPIDYPVETLDFIQRELMRGKMRSDLLSEYKRRRQYPDAEEQRTLEKYTRVLYADLHQFCKSMEMTEKRDMLNAIRFKMERNRKERSTLVEYQKFLQGKIHFIVFRMNMMSVKNDPVLVKWYTYRLIHAFLKLCLESSFHGEQVDVQETRKSLKHGFMAIDEKLDEIDAWHLGKNDYEESIHFFNSQDLRHAWDDMKDFTNHSRMDFFLRKIKEDSLRTAIVESEQEYEIVYSLIAEQGILLWDVLKHQEELVQDRDALEALRWVLSLVRIEQLHIYAGDRLVVERCETLGYEPTPQIEKEYLIKEVLNTGITIGDKILRKASVTVYRYMGVEEEING